MTTRSASPNPLYEEALARREAELRALVSAASPVTSVDEGDVSDFKDIAAVDAQSEVDEARISQASRELAQVMAALTRMGDGTYGICQDCGDPIEQARLLALPEVIYCTSCQSAHERAGRRPVLTLSKSVTR